MQITAKAIAIFASTATLACAPAFAGNYAEGDPRPQPLTAQASAGDVATQTRQWMATAPTVGYPEGNPRASVQVGQKSRAQVNAEAVAWVASGMSQIAYGEVGMDSMGPAYKSAMQAFNSIRASQAAQVSVPRAQ
ncbi:MAG: hypothetical protein JSR41_04710 [Proteobacteria bacterium]|uniref:hypothetical protein n=1 Tax=Pseudacidovorax intermedius TaxID=433924 RepID=UPI00069CCC9B|nr:hypothetical protein [Pseudacidovorax intermedius]MBS0426574.1 hypothetical protein [Pseudomonadota bacterium]